MEAMMHLKITKGQVGRYVLLPGDPGRCEAIARHLEDAAFVASNREYTVYTGKLSGVPVSVCSTGIGGPSSAIAMEELFACGADTFLRVGTCGGIARQVNGGDCVIATGAVRQDGCSREYAPVQFPAVATHAVTEALRTAACRLGFSHHVGIVQSKDSFYGQHSPERMPTAPELQYLWSCWKKLGVLASEMEAATQFVVAASLGARCGAVFHTIWNQEQQDPDYRSKGVFDPDRAIRCAVEAIRILIAEDDA